MKPLGPRMLMALRLTVGLMVVFGFAAIVARMSPPAHAQAGNIPVTLLPSLTRTAASVTTSDQVNNGWQRAHIIVNISAYTSGNYTPKIQAKDPVSGTYYDVCVGTALAATGITILKVGPGLSPLANASCADILPRTWRLALTGASTPSMTFSVGAFLGE